jgi:NRPS condensation-like uncharacterized protein
MTNDLYLDDLKVKSKELGVTINDLLMTLTSITLKQYLVNRGDTKTESLHFSMPISLREPPKTEEELELRNNFAMMSIKLDLV